MGLLASSRSGSRDNFVDLDVPLWAWFALLGVIALMLAVDLFRHRDDHEPTPKEALKESLVWVAFGLAFAGVVLAAFGGKAFTEYLSGYVIEKSLSVDNVFVWSMLFATFAIPLKFQHRVLFWGIFGALGLRAVFIFAGTALIAQFWWVLLVFGALLIVTGAKILRHRNDEGHGPSTRGVGLLRRFMPVSDEFDGHKFVTRINGKRAATPLLAALVVVEITDIIFALDSVPAILAVSNEAFLVFASNAFAIMGLRAMYFLLANAKEKFHLLSHALGIILIYVGVKMSISHWVHIPTLVSLGVIVVLLAAAVWASLKWPKAPASPSPSAAPTQAAAPAQAHGSSPAVPAPSGHDPAEHPPVG
ncbi:MAG: putative TerC family integral rane protein [Ilumatobacteraceae bacterium]|nr:putative TerC family integral rane protein [Ilumatobacteraceae bacterium]